MSFDLLTSQERFSSLKIFISKNSDREDEILNLFSGISFQREDFNKIPWSDDIIYFMEPEHFSRAKTLKGKYPDIFLLTFFEINERLRREILFIKDDIFEFVKILEFIEEVIRERKKIKFLEKVFKQTQHLFKQSNSFTNSREKISMEKNLSIEIFLKLDRGLLEGNKLSFFVSKSEKYFKQLNLWSELELCSFNEIFEKNNVDDSWEFCSLSDLGLDSFLAYKLNLDKKREGYFALALLIEWIEKYTTLHSGKNLENGQETLWDEALREILLPFVFVNEQGDSLIFNQPFSRLNITPRDCLSFKDNETVEVKREIFKVNKVIVDKGEGEQKRYLFFFLNGNSMKNEKNYIEEIRSISSQELGIISSSMAHELNNPLAGILVTIELLELEDWQIEEREALEDMKNSANRCKVLVEIFLGFSRTEDQEQKQGTIREALDRGLDLLRFRMVESSTRIDLEISKELKTFSRKINLSLGSMVLYLIFNEALTLFHHYRLIFGDGGLKSFNVKFSEEADRVIIFFPSYLDLESKVLNSKLIKYLVDIMGFQMEIENNKIVFLDWKLL